MGVNVEQCIEAAWQQIKDRRGCLTPEGVFVKDESPAPRDESRNGSPVSRETGRSVTKSHPAIPATEETSQGGEAVADAWGVVAHDGTVSDAYVHEHKARDHVDMLSHFNNAEGEPFYSGIVPLYRAPPPLLTADERDLISGITDDDEYTQEGQNIAKGILARSGNAPAFTLTAEEREAVDKTAKALAGHSFAFNMSEVAATLRGLLARAGGDK